MQDKINNERILSQLMQKSLLEMPFSDFEETVMKIIFYLFYARHLSWADPEFYFTEPAIQIFKYPIRNDSVTFSDSICLIIPYPARQEFISYQTMDKKTTHLT